MKSSIQPIVNFSSFSKYVLFSFTYPLFLPPSPIPLKSVSQSKATLHTDCHVSLVFFNVEQASDIYFFTYMTLTFLKSAGWLLYGKYRNWELSGSFLWSDSGCMFVPPTVSPQEPVLLVCLALGEATVHHWVELCSSYNLDGWDIRLNFFTLKLFAN